MKKSTLVTYFGLIVAAGILLASCASVAVLSGGTNGNVVTSTGQANTGDPVAVSDPSTDSGPAAKMIAAPASQLAVGGSLCSQQLDGKMAATFGWNPSGSGPQWLDASLLPNDFEQGTFIGLGPFPLETSSFTWDGLTPGRIHYFRVNTLTTNGWEPSKTLVFGTGRCQDGVVVDGPTSDFVALQQKLQAAADGYWSDGEFATAVTDLQTGETVSAYGARPQLSGCVMNWFVLLQSVVDVQSGSVAEEEVGDLISRTIYGSNPVTARDLYEIVGGGSTIAGVEKVSRLIASLGLSSTIIDHPPVYDPGEFPNYSRGVNDNNWITAEDVNKALAKLYWGEILNTGWRDYLLEKMEGVKPGLQYLIGATPGGIISHKNGFFAGDGWIDNDIGIIRFNRGGMTYAYAISFFSQGVPSKYADISLGQEIMGDVWQYFSDKYQ